MTEVPEKIGKMKKNNTENLMASTSVENFEALEDYFQVAPISVRTEKLTMRTLKRGSATSKNTSKRTGISSNKNGASDSGEENVAEEGEKVEEKKKDEVDAAPPPTIYVVNPILTDPPKYNDDEIDPWEEEDTFDLIQKKAEGGEEDAAPENNNEELLEADQVANETPNVPPPSDLRMIKAIAGDFLRDQKADQKIVVQSMRELDEAGDDPNKIKIVLTSVRTKTGSSRVNPPNKSKGFFFRRGKSWIKMKPKSIRKAADNCEVLQMLRANSHQPPIQDI